jgi:hypothetical protein
LNFSQKNNGFIGKRNEPTENRRKAEKEMPPPPSRKQKTIGKRKGPPENGRKIEK